MKKNKKIDAKLLSFTAIAAVLGASFASAVGVFAYGGIMGGNNNDVDYRSDIMSAIEEGDYEKWSDLTDGKRTRIANEGDFEEMIERHSAIEDAINNGDYEEWSNLMDGRGRISDVVTEDNFDTFVAMYEAVEEGDYEKAQELREDLGLGIRSGDGNGFRKGGHGRGMMRGGFNL